MDQVWKCQNCGRLFTDENKYLSHFCTDKEQATSHKCAMCGGTGVVTGFLAPTRTCPTCHGSGRVKGY